MIMATTEEIKDTIFVGGIPYDMTLEEFEEEISTWGHVTKKYLKYHGGWGTVTFDSNSNRNRFLKDKSRHKLWGKIVDIKPYIFNPDKVKNSGTSHLVIGKGQVKMATESSLKAKAEEAKNVSIIEKQMSDLQANSKPIEAQTGAIMKYVGDTDGLIKTPKHGDIAFGIESVYLCRVHKFYCRDSHCANYISLKKWSGTNHGIAQYLPVGTPVSFYCRSIVYKDMPEYKYQATLVWPQASKKPAPLSLPSPDDLNQAMVRFSIELNRSKLSLPWSFPKSSSPTLSQTSSLSNNSVKGSASSGAGNASSNGPPGFSKQQQQTSNGPPGFIGSMQSNSNANMDPFKQAKFNYDVPLEELLDDGNDDLDSEAEILMWIKDFLQNEFGKMGGNVPMQLMNNIRGMSLLRCCFRSA